MVNNELYSEFINILFQLIVDITPEIFYIGFYLGVLSYCISLYIRVYKIVGEGGRMIMITWTLLAFYLSILLYLGGL